MKCHSEGMKNYSQDDFLPMKFLEYVTEGTVYKTNYSIRCITFNTETVTCHKMQKNYTELNSKHQTLAIGI
jgi:hypothetical protein